jgi:hypothetical protein
MISYPQRGGGIKIYAAFFFRDPITAGDTAAPQAYTSRGTQCRAPDGAIAVSTRRLGESHSLARRDSGMFGTLVAAATLALAPAQPGTLNLTNVRATYGELGAVRTDNRYLPGDWYFLAFDIEGITVNSEGKVSYAMSVEVTNKAGQSVFKQEKPVESDEFLPLGGNRLPGRAYVFLKPDQEPGTYTCKVSVTDRVTKATKVLDRPFDVVKKELGLIGLVISYDDKAGMPAPPTGVVGQNLFIHSFLIGFGRGADKKPNASVELLVLDETKRPTLAKPLTATVPKDIGDGDDAARIMFLIPLNREGTFTAQLKAVDAATGKTAIVSIPLRVLSPTK